MTTEIAFNKTLSELSRLSNGRYRRTGYDNPEQALKDLFDAIKFLNKFELVNVVTNVQDKDFVGVSACFKSEFGLFYSFYGAVDNFSHRGGRLLHRWVNTGWTADGYLHYIIDQTSNIIPREKA